MVLKSGVQPSQCPENRWTRKQGQGGLENLPRLASGTAAVELNGIRRNCRPPYSISHPLTGQCDIHVTE